MPQTIDWDGKPTPRLGFGCASMMGRVGRRASNRALHAAWDAGITLFDTARSYGYGEGEALLGEFLQASSHRDRAIVISKFGIPVHPMPRWKAAAKPLVRSALRLLPSARKLVRTHVASDPAPRTYNIQTLRSSLEQTLRALRTDYVDVFLAHEAPASILAQKDLIAELETLVREGKALRVGISASGHDLPCFVRDAPTTLSVLQYPAWGMNDWPLSAERGLRRIANHPFGGAIYAERVADTFDNLAKSPFCTPAFREKLKGDRHIRLAEFWFARARHASHPDVIVTSMLHPSHLRSNLLAIDSDRFTPEDITIIERWIRANDLLR